MAQKKQRRFSFGRRRLSAEPVKASAAKPQRRAQAPRPKTAAPRKKKTPGWQSRLNASGAQNPLLQDMLNEWKRPFDQPMLLITVMLLVVGLIFILSASYPKGYYSKAESIGPLTYFFNQLQYALLGFAVMTAASAFNYRQYHMWGKIMYMLSVVLLIAVLIFGTELNKAKRWLFGFQPSEVAKFALILVFASAISLHPERIRRLKGLIPYGVALGIFVVLLALEPHNSAIIILAAIAVAMLTVGGMRLWYFIPVGAFGVVGAAAMYLGMPHVRARVAVWLDPFSEPLGRGWQACQSLIAVGSGGLTGLGIGQSRQKFLYLPEPMNDFIFSVVCEEIGLIGAILVLILFAYFIFRGFWIACRAEDRMGCLLATGITTKFAVQTIINLCVVTGIFPVTGAALPLFSYGGTALLLQMLEIGILLNVSRHIPQSKRE